MSKIKVFFNRNLGEKLMYETNLMLESVSIFVLKIFDRNIDNFILLRTLLEKVQTCKTYISCYLSSNVLCNKIFLFKNSQTDMNYTFFFNQTFFITEYLDPT